MKKKNIVISVLIILLIVICIFIPKTKEEIKENKNTKNNKNTTNGFLTLMLEQEDGTYQKSTSGTWPGDGYKFNNELSACENGGELYWDSENNIVKLVTSGSDKCYVYFDIYNARTFAQMIEDGTLVLNTSEVNFKQTSPHVISYKDYIYTNDSYTVSSSEINNYYTYGNSYTFDTETGKFNLLNANVGKFSSIYTSLIGKYIVELYGSSSSTISETTNLRKVYKVNNITYDSSNNTAIIQYSHHIGEDDQFSTEDVGLFSSTDDLGNIYFFRGSVTNNYVQFGNYPDNYPDKYIGYRYESGSMNQAKEYTTLTECQSASSYNYNCTKMSLAGKPMYWRIIRTNGDGTIRLIYDGTDTYDVGEEYFNRIVGYSNFNSYYTDNAYIGYMYGSVGSSSYSATHSNVNESNIKKYLENWYNLVLNNDKYKNYIADAIYCNDRSVTSGTGIGTTSTEYGASSRRTNYSPSLKCSQTNDRFSVNTNINSVTTNGKLKYPIGLITADETAYAGNLWNMEGNGKYYLHAGSDYYTMSPNSYTNFSSGTSYLTLWLASYNVSTYPNLYNGIKPVISLKADTLFTGKGTKDNPFVVQID